MASRQEEKEQRRKERLEREEAERKAVARRKRLQYVFGGLLAVAAVGGIVAVLALGVLGGDDGDTGSPSGPSDAASSVELPAQKTGDLKAAAKAAGCTLDNPEIEGSTHEDKDFKASDYKTNPPTSGNHNPEQLADGAYSEMPAPWYFVHSLEHGRIEIQYSPDLSEEDQLALKGVFDESPPGMLFFPNDDMPYEVAVTAWTQLMGCKEYKGRATLDAIRDFRDTYRGLGPEPLPIQTG